VRKRQANATQRPRSEGCYVEGQDDAETGENLGEYGLVGGTCQGGAPARRFGRALAVSFEWTVITALVTLLILGVAWLGMEAVAAVGVAVGIDVDSNLGFPLLGTLASGAYLAWQYQRFNRGREDR
jgi:hypothetical protein